jgi:hypothetical protein
MSSISPHKLRLNASYSFTYGELIQDTLSLTKIKQLAYLWATILWNERPTFLIEPENKTAIPSWTHLVWAKGPPLSEEAKNSELVIIWFSEMTPDTDRVLSVIEWEKHAQDIQDVEL